MLNINKAWEVDLKNDCKDTFADEVINAIDTAISAKDFIAGLYELIQKFGKLEQRITTALGGDHILLKDIKEYFGVISANMKEMNRLNRLASNPDTDPNMAANCWNEHKNYINGTRAYMSSNEYKFVKYKSNIFNKG